MKIFERLILGNFLRYLMYTLAGSFILFTLVDLFDHLGSFIDNHATASMTLRYYLYKGAWIIDQVLPIAVLMATLFTIGSMSRYLELTALYACGLSLLRIARPLLIAGVVLTVGALAWREYVLPEANVRKWQVWEVEIHKKAERLRPTRQITATGPDGRLYYARKYDPNTQVVTGLKVLTLAGPAVVERIDAERAEWDGQHWRLQQGTRRSFRQDQETIESFATLDATDLAITPGGLYRTQVRQENMNIRQLAEHRKLLAQTGGDPTATEVDIQFQLAFPLVNLIVVCLGVVLASGPRRTTVASGFGLTMLVGFGYYLLMMFGRSLGHTGVLPAVGAGWAGNVVYAAATWLLYLRARR
ncbi:MAG TPA: LptF/LptG family permease [Candidatus Krumholzibacteria bacterium]|nr:LptF/LptG family permease [Candidatus Krumholzibacteria bacterium]HPD71302.1 LptF/LptG family permease [Candidatus Krumholzibacteria bacterium]HRY38998.1 LptF/LptG family permease [Candidatus Krumholzibacteria bacterium]